MSRLLLTALIDSGVVEALFSVIGRLDINLNMNNLQNDNLIAKENS